MPYAAVNFPVGYVHAEVVEGCMPGEDMLIGGVDQRAIQIEKHGREWDRRGAVLLAVDRSFIWIRFLRHSVQKLGKSLHQIFFRALIAAVRG